MANKNADITLASFIAPYSQNGLLRSAQSDGSVWLYARIPWSYPLTDGASDKQRQAESDSLEAFFDGLASQVQAGALKYRSLASSQYREFHLFTCAMPQAYRIPRRERGTDIGAWQAQAYGRMTVQRQLAVIGVRLLPNGMSRARKAGKNRLSLWEQAVGWLDRSAFLLASGHLPFDEYEKDAAEIGDIMRRSGLQPFSMMDEREFEDTRNALESWWVPTAFSKELPVLSDGDHMHFFPDRHAAAQAQRLSDSNISCDRWNIPSEFPASVFFVKSTRLENQPVADPASLWIARLMEPAQAGGANAIALSIRGKCEPSRITGAEIRRNRQAIRDNAEKRVRSGRDVSSSMEEAEEHLNYKESIYRADDVPATLIDLSTAVCAAGTAEEAARSLSVVSDEFDFVNLPDDKSQKAAFMSMQPCSPVRVTPYEMHWTGTVVSAGGASSMAKAGDETGALLGFTEANRQPVYLDPRHSAKTSERPYTLVVGDTGSGKLQDVSTLVPVPAQSKYPDGVATMGSLEDGDLVFGRDGKPCHVVKAHPIDRNHEAFEVRFSDGQSIVAGAEHLWIASDWTDRNRRSASKHQASLERRRVTYEAAHRLLDIAERMDAAEIIGLDAIARICSPIVRPLGIRRPRAWAASVLHDWDIPSCGTIAEDIDSSHGQEFRMLQNRKRYDAAQALEALRAYRAGHPRVAMALPDKLPERVCSAQIQAICGCSRATVSRALAGLTPVSEWDETVRQRTRSRKTVRVWRGKTALHALARRLTTRYAQLPEEPDSYYDEQVVSTRDMMESLTASNGGANWAVHVPAPVERPDADLPLDPWVLGAWLADGTRGTGEITSDPHNGDIEYAEKRLNSDGFECRRKKNSPKTTSAYGLRAELRKLGILNDKRIPSAYLNGSIRQRLELVRGLLDQDGTISENGSIEFSQSADHAEIVSGLLTLLRSLGIMAKNPTRSAAAYTDADGVRHPAQDRLRLTFTTSLPVFGLPRKARLIPKETRRTQDWLYVESITPCGRRDMRCITVGSPDGSYLIGGYVPSHNTMSLLVLALQWAQEDSITERGKKIPVVLIDPKTGSDFSEPVTNAGGHVYSMDSDLSDGMLDPLNVYHGDIDQGLNTATVLLTEILDPHGSNPSAETDLRVILDRGIRAGAHMCGTALEKAYQIWKSGQDESLPDSTGEIHRRIMSLANTSRLLRMMFGTHEGTPSLSVSNGLTLIKAGKTNMMPDAQALTATSRIQQWVLRMLTIAAGMAVSYRDGVVIIDEAWTFLGEGAGSSRTIEEWGRLARSQRFMPVMASQKVAEFVDAGLEPYVGRGIILGLSDADESSGARSEAKSALRLLRVADSNGRVRARMPLDAKLNNGSPNYQSLKALKDASGKVVRGSVAYFIDGARPPVPVEVTVPPLLLQQITTELNTDA